MSKFLLAHLHGQWQGRNELQPGASSHSCEVVGSLFQRSSVVERATVNRLVVGSNPTAGANAQPAQNEKLQEYFGLKGPTSSTLHGFPLLAQ